MSYSTSTISFEIAPSYTPNFLRARKVKGGCIIPVKRTDTGELGSLYIVHTPSLKEELVDKCKWVLSCNLPYDKKSPFEGGNKHSSVQTTYVDGILTASIQVKTLPAKLEERLQLYPNKYILADYISESSNCWEEHQDGYYLTDTEVWAVRYGEIYYYIDEIEYRYLKD